MHSTSLERIEDNVRQGGEGLGHFKKGVATEHSVCKRSTTPQMFGVGSKSVGIVIVLCGDEEDRYVYRIVDVEVRRGWKRARSRRPFKH